MKSTIQAPSGVVARGAEEDIGFADFLAVIVRKRWLIILPTLVGVFVAGGIYAVGALKKPVAGERMRYEAQVELMVFNDLTDIVTEYLSSPELLAEAFISPDNGSSATAAEIKDHFPIERLDWETKTRDLGRERSVKVRSRGIVYNQRAVFLNLTAESETVASLAIELSMDSLQKTIFDYNANLKTDYVKQVEVDMGDPAVVGAYTAFLSQKQIVLVQRQPVKIVEAPVALKLPKVRSLLTAVATVFCLSVIAAFAVTWLQGFLADENNRRKLREAFTRKGQGKGSA